VHFFLHKHGLNYFYVCFPGAFFYFLRGDEDMFGLGDFGVSLAFMLCIASAILCVVYGLMNWNKGSDDEAEQIKEELKWQIEENQIDDQL
jgi:hypothetical protein